MNKETIVAIDFDGTLVEDRYPEIGELKSGVKDAMRQINAKNEFYIIINTCRKGKLLVEAINFLLNEGIQFDRVNDNAPWLIEKYGNTRKIHANVFIDSNNIGGLPPWSEMPEVLKQYGLPF
jgi:hypothetical protein